MFVTCCLDYYVNFLILCFTLESACVLSRFGGFLYELFDSFAISSAECQTSDWSLGHQRKCRDVGITTLAPSARNGLKFRASRDCLERDQNKIRFKPREEVMWLLIC